MDDAGTWFRCCALGRNASSPDLRKGMVVVLYFALGRPQYGSSPGMVYLMRDSLIVPIEHKTILCPKKAQLEIQSPQVPWDTNGLLLQGKTSALSLQCSIMEWLFLFVHLCFIVEFLIRRSWELILMFVFQPQALYESRFFQYLFSRRFQVSQCMCFLKFVHRCEFYHFRAVASIMDVLF